MTRLGCGLMVAGCLGLGGAILAHGLGTDAARAAGVPWACLWLVGLLLAEEMRPRRSRRWT